jgi:anaerobic ribonucleoside-triphosphate reductase activating protein
VNFTNHQVVLSEVPDEITLAFNLCGCPLRCEGCHSPELRNPSFGKELTDVIFTNSLQKYKQFISCVLFFGGEWDENWIIEKLKEIKQTGLKTCLYSGHDNISDRIKEHLNYLKIGPYEKDKGGLASPSTNQKFIDMETGTILNYRFCREYK